jgi:hypothetical protein
MRRNPSVVWYQNAPNTFRIKYLFNYCRRFLIILCLCSMKNWTYCTLQNTLTCSDYPIIISNIVGTTTNFEFNHDWQGNSLQNKNHPRLLHAVVHLSLGNLRPGNRSGGNVTFFNVDRHFDIGGHLYRRTVRFVIIECSCCSFIIFFCTYYTRSLVLLVDFWNLHEEDFYKKKTPFFFSR